MRTFSFSDQQLDPEGYRSELADASAGGYVPF